MGKFGPVAYVVFMLGGTCAYVLVDGDEFFFSLLWAEYVMRFGVSLGSLSDEGWVCIPALFG